MLNNKKGRLPHHGNSPARDHTPSTPSRPFVSHGITAGNRVYRCALLSVILKSFIIFEKREGGRRSSARAFYGLTLLPKEIEVPKELGLAIYDIGKGMETILRLR